MILKLILAISIVLQITTAAMAFRLIGITGRRMAWVLITMALILMAIRRVMPLYHLMSGQLNFVVDPLNESIGLVLSLLMMIGIARIGPIFFEKKRTEEEIGRLNAGLQAGAWGCLSLIC